jgi:hypothetical protein
LRGRAVGFATDESTALPAGEVTFTVMAYPSR